MICLNICFGQHGNIQVNKLTSYAEVYAKLIYYYDRCFAWNLHQFSRCDAVSCFSNAAVANETQCLFHFVHLFCFPFVQLRRRLTLFLFFDSTLFSKCISCTSFYPLIFTTDFIWYFSFPSRIWMSHLKLIPSLKPLKSNIYCHRIARIVDSFEMLHFVIFL